MKKILFATGNENKVKEIRSLISDLPYQIITMGQIGFHEDIPETGKTLKENAILKAKYLYAKTNENTIAEDTGLEVDSLEAAPGVFTARYAGENKDPHANMDLLLKNIKGIPDRSAQFRTVIALILEGELYTFEGIARGSIAFRKIGKAGFAYDPIFIPEGYDITFAQMDLSTKSTISHRGRAMKKMLEFLNS